ncbi:unnamed protein product [Echinostoma caproni]|uniref:Similar to n=1 Tax=Echinostoma caproni TaxID=27848 RepID=A0A183AGW9_9TREM|nr:unnamed protein product [Echinostoma caproni]
MLSSYFSATRATHYNFRKNSQRSSSASPRAASRHTPTDRYTPSAHFTEILDSSYSHQIIGPTVYSGENSGHSSPRSRSTMTMLFSGKRSPTTTKRSPSRTSSPAPRSALRDSVTTKYSMTPSPRRTSSPIYPPVQTPIHLAPPAQHNLLSLGQSDPELPRYVDPMNELSKLKTQLNSIQRLISGEDSHSSRSTTVGYLTSKGVQTDETETERELNFAKQQIVELTRMLQAKDVVLRKTEQENMRLNEAVRRLRDLGRQKTSSETSSTRSYTPTPTNSARVYTSNTRLGGTPTQSAVPRTGSMRYSSEHSYDPRLNALQGVKHAPYINQPTNIMNYDSNDVDGEMHQAYRPEPRRARTRNDNIFCGMNDNMSKVIGLTALWDHKNWCSRQDQDGRPTAETFEEGDVRAFLEDFEDITELAGVWSDRGNLTALRALLTPRPTTGRRCGASRRHDSELG